MGGCNNPLDAAASRPAGGESRLSERHHKNINIVTKKRDNKTQVGYYLFIETKYPTNPKECKMTTITIAHEVSADKVEAIQQMLNHEEINNVNFNGENFTVERGDFTSIDSDDDAQYVVLLGKIQDIILGYN